jgi:hypothetical protein
MASETKPIKTQLLAQLKEVISSTGALRAKRGDNFGPVLRKLYLLQEMSDYAEDELKAAWAEATKEGVLPPDDDLREEKGERIVTESEQFSLIVSVDKPRKTFSRDKFVEAIAKKFKIDRAKLDALIATATTDGKAPLSKRILEVG